MNKKKGLDLELIQEKVMAADPSKQDGSETDTPDYVGRRLEAQSSINRGKREKRLTYRIDPENCRIRDDHDRDYSNLSVDNCRELIDGIKIHGQETPAIVRTLDNNPEYQYEIVCGARRHWVATYLKIELIVEVRELSEEGAFIVSDEENRNRKDISDYERAKKYKRALEELYKNQIQMAERMGVTTDWLSRYLSLASLHEDIVAAYKDLSEIKTRHARELKILMKDKVVSKRILDKAREYHSSPLKGSELISKLKAVAIQKRRAAVKQKAYGAGKGDKFLVLKSQSTNKLVLELSTKEKTSFDDWVKALKALHSDTQIRD